jgi:phage repressor protein C with HTH and peptisase S24 domain
MTPTLHPGQIVIASGRFLRPKSGQVVVISHNGLQKIKRIERVDPLRGVFVVGDNPIQSTDSRQFGWINTNNIIGRVIWPRTSLL